MSKDEPGWTIETLFYHFTRIVDDLGRRIDERVLAAEKAATLALGSSEKAIAKAEYASEKRFEGVNEFRGALADASRNNITRGEVDKQFEAMTDKIKDLGDRLNRSEGNKQGLLDGWKIMVAVLGLLAVIFAILSAVKHWN
jgi:uncharacterized protein YaaR (DUF327 family)